MATRGKHILTVTTADAGAGILFGGAGFTIKSIHVLGNGTTVAGHQYRLEDGDGNLLYRSQASGAWYESESITQRRWSNIQVITLDSGIIDIEYEQLGAVDY